MSSSETSENGNFFQDSPVTTPRGRRGRSRSARRGSRGSRGGTTRGRSRSGSGTGGRSRSGSRARGRSRSRGRGRMQEEDSERAADLLKERDEKIKNEIAGMETEALRRLCLDMVSAQPGLVFDILHPAVRQPEGYHPPPGTNWPDWCVCLKCRQMPSEVERLCCGKAECISLLPNFNILVLDEEVLAIGRIFRRDVLVYDDEGDRHKANRHQGYRQYIMWQHGRLGAGVRRVVPSCAVWAIRDRYPDAFGQYTGFKPSRFE